MSKAIKEVNVCDVCGKICNENELTYINMNWASATTKNEVIEICVDCGESLRKLYDERNMQSKTNIRKYMFVKILRRILNIDKHIFDFSDLVSSI